VQSAVLACWNNETNQVEQYSARGVEVVEPAVLKEAGDLRSEIRHGLGREEEVVECHRKARPDAIGQFGRLPPAGPLVVCGEVLNVPALLPAVEPEVLTFSVVRRDRKLLAEAGRNADTVRTVRVLFNISLFLTSLAQGTAAVREMGIGRVRGRRESCRRSWVSDPEEF
jgi:hypothetical protein